MFSTVQQTTMSNPADKQQGVDAKKRKFSPNVNKSNSTSIDGSMITPPRILARRYPLTKTGYKYLDIGINVSTPSHIEIALGDNHGKEIHFTYNMWKILLDQRHAIHHFFNNDANEAPSQTIEHVTLRFGKINNLKVLRLETSTVCLVMSHNTVCNIIALEYCVDHIAQSLNNVTGMVDTKFAHFRKIASGAKDPIAVIRESESFDKNDIIDCELLAQIFGSQ
ncbi:uncharacterized protein [Linepithema humile]|uniref:uncharacterized protein n=1 Tax=Linepithema humile TaxID=83485 RepID=UPI00351F49A7